MRGMGFGPPVPKPLDPRMYILFLWVDGALLEAMNVISMQQHSMSPLAKKDLKT